MNISSYQVVRLCSTLLLLDYRSVLFSSSRVLYLGTQPSPEDCPLGQYRKIGAGTTLDQCTLCPRGVYGSSTGLTTSACSAPCPKGTYGDKLGGKSYLDCSSCPAGVYGSTTGLTTSACSAPCPRGTYSITKGLTRENQCSKCPINYRGSQGLRGNNVKGRHSGGHPCDMFWKDGEKTFGRDEYYESIHILA